MTLRTFSIPTAPYLRIEIRLEPANDDYSWVVTDLRTHKARKGFLYKTVAAAIRDARAWAQHSEHGSQEESAV
jgi:hypothetical protein